MANRFVVNKKGRLQQTYSFSMQTSDIVWSCVGAGLALTIFFLFGVLVGRGYFPADQDLAVDPQFQVSEHGELSGEAEAANATEEVQVESPVLLSEELNYPDKLAGRVPVSTPVESAAPVQTTPQASADSEQQPIASTETAAEAAPAPETQPEAQPGEQVYDYIYQAASSKNHDASNVLRDKLVEKGLEAKVTEGSVDGSTWFRVRVHFTGTPSQTEPVRKAISSVTGEKPLRLSKKLAE